MAQNKYMKVNNLITSKKMKVMDWTLSILSLAYAAYLYFISGNDIAAAWWLAGGLLGVVFSIWRPLDRIQKYFQRTMIKRR